MSVLVAIDVNADEAQVVTAEPLDSGRFRILGCYDIPIDRAEPSGIEAEYEDQSSDEEETNENTDPENKIKLIPLPEDQDVDAVLAVTSHYPVFSEVLDLPFKDQKTLSQVAPLQLQDVVPFDVSEFVTDTLVLNNSDNGQNEVLASLLPTQLVSHDLAAVQKLGVDPKLLSTKASIFTSFVSFLPEDDGRSFVLVFSSKKQVSLAIVHEGALVFIREFFGDFENRHQVERTMKDILASTARFEAEMSTKFSSAWVGGNADVCQAVANTGKWQTKQIDLTSFYDLASGVNAPKDDISWAIALFTAELKPKENLPLVNFRRGKFSYRPFFQNLGDALKEEISWIIYACIFGFLWVSSVWYTSASRLSTIEDAISKQMRAAIPGESFIPGQESSDLQNKISYIEEQLSDLGSLSSLSPLESLKELSEAIKPTININLESINIGHKGLSMRGSVANSPAVGKLDSALSSRKEQFCNVSVKPRGTVPGSGRVKFEAELTFCE